MFRCKLFPFQCVTCFSPILATPGKSRVYNFLEESLKPLPLSPHATTQTDLLLEEKLLTTQHAQHAYANRGNSSSVPGICSSKKPYGDIAAVCFRVHWHTGTKTDMVARLEQQILECSKPEQKQENHFKFSGRHKMSRAKPMCAIFHHGPYKFKMLQELERIAHTLAS